MACVCVDYWSAVTFYYLFSPLELQIRTDESYLTHSRPLLRWTLFTLEDQMFSLMIHVKQIIAEVVVTDQSFFSPRAGACSGGDRV